MSETEMLEGYLDGRDLDNPIPSDNRSHSYRHGFANGRADKENRRAFPSVKAAQECADLAIEKDNAK